MRGDRMFEMIGFQVAKLYLIYRYMHCFFEKKQMPRRRTLAAYGVYLAVVCCMDTLPFPYLLNIVLLYLLAQCYHGRKGKKLFAAFLIQGMNLLCETLAVCLLYDGRVDVFVRAYHGEFLYQAYQGGYGVKTLGFAGLFAHYQRHYRICADSL